MIIQNKILQYTYILSGKMGNFHSATYLVQKVLDYWDKGVQIFQKILIHIEFSCSLQSTYLINLDYQGFSGKITVINSFLVIKEIFTL